MSLDLSQLLTGSWEFGLEVEDAENSEAAVLHRVDILQDTPPTAVVAQGPERYLVVNGALEVEVVLDGSASFDPDNGPDNSGGIAKWEWELLAPSGCVPPSPANEKTTRSTRPGRPSPPRATAMGGRAHGHRRRRPVTQQHLRVLVRDRQLRQGGLHRLPALAAGAAGGRVLGQSQDPGRLPPRFGDLRLRPVQVRPHRQAEDLPRRRPEPGRLR